MSTPSFAVDLDGTIATYNGWKGILNIGEPILGAVEFVRRLSKKGRVIIFTARLNRKENKLDDTNFTIAFLTVEAWLKKHGFVFDEIYSGEGKPHAHAFIDDRGVACRPQDNKNAFDEAIKYIDEKILSKGIYK